MNKEKSFKCSQCLKSFSESESDNCDNCGQKFCAECLIYQGTNEELAFCGSCEKGN